MADAPHDPQEITADFVIALRDELFRRTLSRIDRRLKDRRLEAHSAEVLDYVLKTVFCQATIELAFQSFDASKGRTWEDYILRRVDLAIGDWLKKHADNPIAFTSNEASTGESITPENPDFDPTESADPFDPLKPVLETLPDSQRSCWTLEQLAVRRLLADDRDAMQRYSERERAVLNQLLSALKATLKLRQLDNQKDAEAAVEEAVAEVEFRTNQLQKLARKDRMLRQELTGLDVTRTTIEQVEKLAAPLTQDDVAHNWERYERKLLSADVRRAKRPLHEFAQVCQEKRWIESRLAAAREEFQKVDSKVSDPAKPTSPEMGEVLNKPVKTIWETLSKAKKAIENAKAGLRERLANHFKAAAASGPLAQQGGP